MKVQIQITYILLYSVFGKRNDIEVVFQGDTLADMVKALIRKHGKPIKDALLEDDGGLSAEVRIYRNGIVLQGDRMRETLCENDVLLIGGGG